MLKRETGPCGFGLRAVGIRLRLRSSRFLGLMEFSAVQLSSNDLLLVTGATGLVGSHVAEQARHKGLRVRTLVRSGADTTLLQKWGCELVTGDLDQPESLAAACRDVTVVIHCAA